MEPVDLVEVVAEHLELPRHAPAVDAVGEERIADRGEWGGEGEADPQLVVGAHPEVGIEAAQLPEELGVGEHAGAATGDGVAGQEAAAHVAGGRRQSTTEELEAFVDVRGAHAAPRRTGSRGDGAELAGKLPGAQGRHRR